MSGLQVGDDAPQCASMSTYACVEERVPGRRSRRGGGRAPVEVAVARVGQALPHLILAHNLPNKAFAGLRALLGCCSSPWGLARKLQSICVSGSISGCCSSP